jgi:hypothetical protein
VTEMDSNNLLGLNILTIKVGVKNHDKAIIVRGNVKVSIK